MSTSRELDDEALGRVLAPFDLRLKRRRTFSPDHLNPCAATDGGIVILRDNPNRSAAQLRHEAARLWRLAMHRFPTPQPLRTSDGTPFVHHQGRLITVFPWIAAAPHLPGAHSDDSVFAQIGALLGRLHRHLGELDTPSRDHYGLAPLRTRVATVAHQPEAAPVLPLLDEELAILESNDIDLPRTILHGQLTPRHVLWRKGRIVAVLDFADAGAGRLIYDLAVTLLTWCWSGSDLDDHRIRILVNAYHAVRPLSPPERDALLHEVRLAALAQLIARLSDRGDAEDSTRTLESELLCIERLRSSLPGRSHAWFEPAA